MRKINLPRLYPYQVDVMARATDVNVVIFGRRTGKTLMSAVLAISSALRGAKVAWVAPNYTNTVPLWDLCLKYLQHLDGNGVRILKADRSIIFEDTFGRISIFSADNQSSMLGRDNDLVFIDEAARIKDERLWFEVLRPTLADRNGKAFLISTPRGKNWLYREYLQGIAEEDGYASFHLPTTANPNQTIRDFVEKVKSTTPPLLFQQEYEAKFISDGEVFANVQEVCCLAPLDNPIDGHTYVAGVDFARTNDYTVVVILDAETRQQVAMERFTDLPHKNQLDAIEKILNHWRVESCIAEFNSMGSPMVEFLQLRDLPVTGFVTTNRSKQEAIDSLVLAFANREISLLDDSQVVLEFLSYEMGYTPGGLVKYGGSSGVHDDIVMATALAWLAVYDSKPLLLF